LTPGQAGDAPQFESLLRYVITDPEQAAAVEAILADKGYDSNAILELIASWEAEAVIPSRKNRTQARAHDEELYEGRNVVERLIGRVKQYRRVAMRYEKTARNYLAMLHLASAIVWLL
jgi:transposase